MAAAAVKLPLAVKKGLKDAQPDFQKQLEMIQAAVGFPVTYNFNVEALYAATEGHDRHDQIATVALDYLERARDSICREAQDELAKPQLVSLWTTKNITLTCEPESFDGHEYKKTHIAEWDGYCGLRIVNGDLDIFTKRDRYFSNTDHVSQVKFVNLFANAPGDLPLAIRKEIRDTADKQKAVSERIAKALKIDAVKIDWEGDAKAIVARGSKLKYPFNMENAIRYFDEFAQCLEYQAEDEMIKEAINDVFSTKTVSLKVYDSVEGVKGLELHNSYNGIQFLDGQIILFAPQDNFCVNIDQIRYEHKIVNLF